MAEIALQILATTAKSLVTEGEQEDTLRIITRIEQESDWRIPHLKEELKALWNWDVESNITASLDSSGDNIGALHEQQQIIDAATQQISPPTIEEQKDNHEQRQQRDSEMYIYPPSEMQTQHENKRTLFRPSRGRIAGILNPLLATPDYSLPQHLHQPDNLAPTMSNFLNDHS